MKKLLSIFTAVVLSATMLAGCGGSSQSSSDDQGGNETQQTSKTLIIGSVSAPRTLNPLFFPSRQDSIVTNLIFDNFVEPDKDGKIVGSLVKNIEISDDGLNYKFELNSGVKWHDGETFDGDDVVATFNMLANPLYKGGVDRINNVVGVKQYQEALENGETDASISGITLSEDKMTVEVTIDEVSASFLPGLYFAILPEHKIAEFDIANLEEEKFNTNPVGTGPFVFEELTVGSKISLEKNPNYFKGEPTVGKVIVKFGEAIALTTQLETGEIDMLEVNKDGFATFDGDSNFNVYSYPMSSVSYVGFRTGPGRAEDTKGYKPVYSKEIRQALAYATNEAVLVDAAYGAAGYAHDSVFPKGSMGDSDSDVNYSHNVDKAKSIIESQGYKIGNSGFYEKDGEVLQVEVLYAESNTQVAEILKEQWKQAGVDAKIKLLDFGALIQVLLRQSDKDGNVKSDGATYDEATLKTDANFDAYLLGFAQESDPDEYSQYFTDDDFWNFYHYENADVVKWFEQQAVEINEQKRSEILNKISEQLSKDLPWYTYAGSNEIIVTGNNLSGFNPDSRGYTMNAHTWVLE